MYTIEGDHTIKTLPILIAGLTFHPQGLCIDENNVMWSQKDQGPVLYSPQIPLHRASGQLVSLLN